MWQYSYDVTGIGQTNFKMRIDQIEIEGVENGDYSCKKCDIMITDKNGGNSDDMCRSCDEGKYFDLKSVIIILLIV